MPNSELGPKPFNEMKYHGTSACRDVIIFILEAIQNGETCVDVEINNDISTNNNGVRSSVKRNKRK